MKEKLPLTGDMIAIIRSYRPFVINETKTGLLTGSYDYGRHRWARTCHTTTGFVYHDEVIEALYRSIEYDVRVSVRQVEINK